MKKTARLRIWLKNWSWAFFLAAALSEAPLALLYIGLAGGEEMNGHLTQAETAKLLHCAFLLEFPGRLLLPDTEYPMFWNSHLQAEYFWPEVGRYFALNFFAWWVTLILLGYAAKFIKKSLYNQNKPRPYP